MDKETEPSMANAPHFDMDAYAPAQIAERVERAGIAKTRAPLTQTFALGVLAGAFIAFGALFYTLVTTGSGLGFGPTRMLGGVAFSLGLILVVVAGAELFTGNNLIVIAWADKKITALDVLRNWSIVYVANFFGALLIAGLVIGSGTFSVGDGAVGATATAMADAKLQLSASQAFFRGILCNALVCLAVWLCFAARSVTDKILAIVFPISAFVGLGFEHSVANMYVVPVAMMAGLTDGTLAALLQNLLFVTLGNIVGGAGGVALAYWFVYGRDRD